VPNGSAARQRAVEHHRRLRPDKLTHRQPSQSPLRAFVFLQTDEKLSYRRFLEIDLGGPGNPARAPFLSRQAAMTRLWSRSSAAWALSPLSPRSLASRAVAAESWERGRWSCHGCLRLRRTMAPNPAAQEWPLTAHLRPSRRRARMPV